MARNRNRDNFLIRDAKRVLDMIVEDNSDISDLSDGEESDDTIDYEPNASDGSSEESDPDDNADATEDVQAAPTKQRVAPNLKWKQSDVFIAEVEDYEEPESTFHDRVDVWSTFDYVKQYIDYEQFELLSTCTNIQTTLTNTRGLNTTPEEIQRFFGICLMMSCLGYPAIRMYWQKSFRVPVIADIMTRDRFFKIRGSLKVVVDADVSADTKLNDKFWKVRPLIDSVLKGCRAQPRSEHVAIDEQMIPFTGACPSKQYVPNKPNPVGLKNFVLANPQGLVLDFVIYQNSQQFQVGAVPNEYRIGIGGSVIVHLCETLSTGSRLFCDRYFTSLGLIQYLHEKKIYVTGTVMKNRISAPMKLVIDEKALAKRGRGSSNMVVQGDSKACVVTWFDNKPITLASSCFGIEPQEVCRRWSKKDKQYIEISRPSVVQEYNTNMGGVDLMDRMISFYRLKARTRKWTIRTIMHMFDLSVANAWILYKKDKVENRATRNDTMQFLEYRMDIAEHFMSTPDKKAVPDDSEENLGSDSDDEVQPVKRTKTVPVPSLPRRKSEAKHLPESVEMKNAMRCRREGCSGKSRIRCTSCKVFLCLTSVRNCYAGFHSGQ